MLRTFALLALALLVGGAAAQPDPKKKPDEKPVTKVYGIGSLISERGKAGGIADTDAVIKLIFEAIPELRDLKPGTEGTQIVDVGGGRLEVRAPAAVQEQVNDLLEAIRRLQDVAVDVTSEVIEFDAPGYDKLLKALPKGKAKPPVLYATGEEVGGKADPNADKAFAEAVKLLKAGREVQTAKGRFLNGAESTVTARRTLATFTTVPGGDVKKDDHPQFVKEGFGLVAVPVVSADRHYIRFKLTEQSTVISGVRKRELGEIGGMKLVAQTFDTDDLGATGSAVVADGGTLLFKLAYAPKDNVWVVVLKPTIFIQAEEDILKKEGKK